MTSPTSPVMVALLAGALLLPASPSGAEEVQLDCRSLGEGGSGPSPGVFRLACPVVSIECVDDAAGEVCRAAVGTVTVVGGSACWRPAGPPPAAINHVCETVLDGIGDALRDTGCGDTVPVGDARVMPNVFVRLRDHDDGPTVVGVAASCGGRRATCDFDVHEDLRPDADCEGF